MLKINFTASTKKSIILTIFALFLLMCIFMLMVGSTFHIAEPPNSYLGIDNIAETDSQRLRFINALGYTVGATSEESATIIIPMEFGDVYNRYNELQKESGGNLLNYRGAECTRYTYIETDNIHRINLIVYKGRVIGGDECTTALDGEMTPLINNS